MRYFYECFISYPLSTPLDWEDLFDGDDIECFLHELNLSGEVAVLLPGDGNLPCKDGFVWVNRVGKICIMEKG